MTDAVHPKIPLSKRPKTDIICDDIPDDDEEFFPTDVVFSSDEENEPIPIVPTPVIQPIIEKEKPIQVQYRRVLKHVPDVPYVRVSCSDGSRVYLRIFPEKPLELPKSNDQGNKPTNKNVLGVPFHELRKQAEVSVSSVQC